LIPYDDFKPLKTFTSLFKNGRVEEFMVYFSSMAKHICTFSLDLIKTLPTLPTLPYVFIK
jgi:hypothetical protein